ncbi:hypothetical protein GGR42_001102 [Saonia flava]|uniref:Uncharacterized protein n=1 Tax=Saonia flava TaxID=523696 RepID=A0A846QUL1_9FLAO|nr:hypothetical protein [Saonia flava]
MNTTFATDAELAALNTDDADAVIGNESVTGLTFDGTTLTLAQDGAANETVNLSSVNTDDQTAGEVNLVTAVDTDGDAANETTVEGAVQAMAPIVSKAARIFYPPSIAVDASTTGTGRILNLYTEYTTQFGTPMVSSNLAPAAIPTYTNTELYYYVTYYDNSVFANVSVNEFGVMTYDVIASPADYNSLINVVFVVK